MCVSYCVLILSLLVYYLNPGRLSEGPVSLTPFTYLISSPAIAVCAGVSEEECLSVEKDGSYSRCGAQITITAAADGHFKHSTLPPSARRPGPF